MALILAVLVSVVFAIPAGVLLLAYLFGRDCEVTLTVYRPAESEDTLKEHVCDLEPEPDDTPEDPIERAMHEHRAIYGHEGEPS